MHSPARSGSGGRPRCAVRTFGRVLFVLLFLLLLEWGIWFVGGSHSFGNCIKTYKNYQAFHALHEKQFFIIQFFARFKLHSICVLRVVNVYQGAVAALAGVVVAAFTATLWWATLGMLSVSREQLEAIRKQGEHAERALISAERAFVFQHNMDISASLHPDGTVLAWVIIPGWKNSGSTPARHVVCHVSLHYQQGYLRLPDSFDFPEQWDIDEPEIFMVSIAPHGQIGDAAKRVPIAELMVSLQKKNRIFMYGWIEYDDAFQETHRHRTEFCVEIIVRTDPRVDYGKAPEGSRVTPFLFSFQGRHNGVEDECSKKAAPPEQRLAELRESRKNALEPRPGDFVRPGHDEFLPPIPTPSSG